MKSSNFGRHIYLALVFGLSVLHSLPSAAQFEPDTSSGKTAKADSLLRFIPKEGMKSIFLYDRVLPVADLTAPAPESGRVTSGPHFRQALFELHQSSIAKGLTWVDQTKYYALVAYYKERRVLPIAVLDTKIDFIRPDAVEAGLLQFRSDSLMEPTQTYLSSRSTSNSPSLYSQRDVTLALPLAHDDRVIKGPNYIKLDTLGLTSYTARSVVSVDVLFNGDTTLLSPGDSLLVNFANVDTAIIGLTVNFSDGSRVRTVSSIATIPSPTEPCLHQGFQGYPFSVSSYPQNQDQWYGERSYKVPDGHNDVGVAELSVWYGGGDLSSACGTDTKLDKPILFVDGFDPGNKRDATSIYTKSLTYYKNGASTPDYIGDELRTLEQSDVMVVDFPDYSDALPAYYYNQSQHPVGMPRRLPEPHPGMPLDWYKDHGAGFIEQNALALVKIIQYTNNQLRANGSSEKIVIVGPSMGGLITRYALSYMEKQYASAPVSEKEQWNHNTKLYISFDSPHLGANVPIGGQEFLDFFSNVETSAAISLMKTINSKAARQMLLAHINSRPLNDVSGDPEYRSRWVQNQGSVNPATGGWPVGIEPNGFKKVAVINGSMFGTRQLTETNLNRNIFNPVLGCNNGATLGLRMRVSRGFNSILVASANIRYSPENGGTCTTFDAWHQTQGASHNWPHNAIDAGIGIDESPGGSFNTFEEIWKNADGSHDASFRHSFIPSKSALALRSGLSNLGEDLSTRDLVCSGETPFDDYVALNWNSPHIYIDEYIRDRMFDYLHGNFNVMPRPTTVIPMSGPELVCSANQNFALTLPSYLSAGPQSSLAWQYSPLQFVTSAANSLSITLKAPVAAYGDATVSAQGTYVNAQGISCPLKSSKAVSFGIAPPQISGNQSICKGESNQYEIRNTSRYTTTSWSLSNPSNSCFNISTWGLAWGQCTVAATSGACSNTLRVTAQNACGIATGSKRLSSRICSGGPMRGPVANPPVGTVGGSILQVSVLDKDGLPVTDAAGSYVLLTDARGNPLAKDVLNNLASTELNVSGLQAAAYLVQITYPDGSSDELDWYIGSADQGNLVVSPNPAVTGIDQSLFVRVLGVPDTAGPYQVRLVSDAGSTVFEGRMDWPHFELDARNLAPGLYHLSAIAQDGTTWEEELEVLLKDAPHLSISPNPVSASGRAVLDRPVSGLDKLGVIIVNSQGNSVLGPWDNLPASGFDIDVSGLQPGPYRLIVNDGQRNYSVLFDKL